MRVRDWNVRRRKKTGEKNDYGNASQIKKKGVPGTGGCSKKTKWETSEQNHPRRLPKSKGKPGDAGSKNMKKKVQAKKNIRPFLDQIICIERTQLGIYSAT